MANTTFNGPVRAEGGFKQVSKNASTGAFTDQLTVDSSGNLAQTAGVNNLITDVENLTAATKTVTAADTGTTRVLPLCVAASRVLFSSPNATGASPIVIISVIAPVLEFLLIVLSVLSDLIGPEKVVFAMLISS